MHRKAISLTAAIILALSITFVARPAFAEVQDEGLAIETRQTLATDGSGEVKQPVIEPTGENPADSSNPEPEDPGKASDKVEEGLQPTEQKQDDALEGGDESKPDDDGVDDDGGIKDPDGNTSPESSSDTEGKNPDAPDTPAGNGEDANKDCVKDTPEPKAQEKTAAQTPATTATTSAETKLSAQAGDSKEQIALDKFALQHAKDLPAGRYAIYANAQPEKSGDKTRYGFDVQSNSKKSGASIILYRAGTGTNQRWDIAYLDSGYALIKSVASGLYLALSNGANAFKNGATPILVQQAYNAGAAWQKWIIVRQSDGSLKLLSGLLRNGTQRHYVDVRGGKAKNVASLIAYKEKTSGDANQRFSFVTTNDILDAEAKSHKGDVKDGTYIVSSGINGAFVLNMRYASLNNGQTAVLYKGSEGMNEGWIIKHVGVGYITITGLNSGKVLDVRGGAARSNTSIIQWTAKSGARNQQWIAEKASDGSIQLVSALAGNVRLVLGVSGGKATNYAGIVLQGKSAASNKGQAWKFTEAPDHLKYAKALKDGTFFVRSGRDLTKVLDVPHSSKDNNVQVKLWTAKRGSNNQYWIVTHDKQGYVLLKNKNSGKYLNFSSNKVGGYNVSNQTSAAGRWVAKPAANGSYMLVNASNGLALDLQNGKTANGSTVLAYRAHGGANQQWVIEADLKIAIDPGHGANDSGATGNGLRECDLNWEIANACASQLRSYGFEVYMTMSQSEFKNSSISTPSIQTRVNRAYNAGCTAIFSMHINAANGSARGAEVLVPNSSSFHKEFYTMGQKFTKDVLGRFNKELGLANRGPLIRNYSAAETGGENMFYTGGGYADYYGIVRYARLKGMFGVIIEHGFIDNAADARILKANTRKLGQLDAAAIKALFS